MSKLIEVIEEHLSGAELDERLTRGERHLLGALLVAMSAFREGTDLWTYSAQAQAEAEAEEAVLARRTAAKARRARARRSAASKRGGRVSHGKAGRTPMRRAAEKLGRLSADKPQTRAAA